MSRKRRNWSAAGLAAVICILVAAFVSSGASGASKSDSISFEMARSAVVQTAGCLPDARADVSVRSLGPVEMMKVDVEGLPKKTEFDFFVIQGGCPTSCVSGSGQSVSEVDFE
jgi:hypothetical protein